MKKIILISFIIFFSLISGILAQPFNVQEHINTLAGIEVQVLTEKFVKQNQTININVHPFNTSTGLLLTNLTTSCELNVFNYSGIEKLINKRMVYDAEQELFNLTINSSTFFDFTYYPFIVHCNSSNVGGFSSGSFLVTRNGREEKTFDMTAIIIMLSLIVFVYLWFIRTLNQDVLAQHGLVKSSLFVFVFWFLLLPLNLMIESMGQSGASSQMIGMISTAHIAIIYMNVTLTFYFMIYLIVSFVRSINENVQK